jgi:RNA-binding protein 15
MSTRNLFVGNLEVNITSDELRKIFGAFGNVTDIDVKRPPPGSGNAFAFVRYENLDMAHSAKQELSGNTCSCNLTYAYPNFPNLDDFKFILLLILFSGQFIGKFQCKIGYGKAHPTPKIWVGQLGSWCSESLLWKEFDRFGAIKSIEYLKGDNFAYILYEMVDAAQAAVQEMRGFPLGGPDRRLRLDFADVEGFPEETATHHDTDNGKRISYTSGSKNNYNDQDKGDYHLRRRENESGDRLRSREDDRSGDLRRESHLIVAQTVSDLCRKTPNVWDGGLILKNSLFPTRLHLIDGSRQIADSLKDEDDNNNLKIMQRLRLDQSKLDDVNKRIANSTSHAIFLGVPASMSLEHSSPEIQSRHLRNLVTYLKQKEAAGVISMTLREYLGDTSSVLYCFPPCEYARDLLQRRDCNLTEEVKEDFLIVVVVCGSRA